MKGEAVSERAGPKPCPNCRLINPPSAQRCDCGWDFTLLRMEGSYLPRTLRREASSDERGVDTVEAALGVARIVLNILRLFH